MSKTLVTMAVLALAVTACGGAGPTPADSDDAETETTAPAEDEQTEEGQPETLAAYFGWNADPEEQATRYREQEAEIQEKIRVCMAEEGFEYIPMQPTDDAYVFTSETPEEYAAEFGFGISTWIGREETTDTTTQEWVDPNQEIVEAMSESERTAYYEALNGTEEENAALTRTEPDPETGEEFEVMEGYGAGCWGEAAEEVYGTSPDQAFYEEFSDELEAMYERVQADPRMAELDAAWSACMSDQGYDYESPTVMYETVYEDFQARVDAIVGPNGGYVDPFAGWTEEEITAFYEEKTQEEIDAFFAKARSKPPEYDTAALSALQEEEIALAVAAAQCQKDYDERYQEVNAEYEAEFIAANRDALDALKNGGAGE
jgi:predicted small lipoprotein YifL